MLKVQPVLWARADGCLLVGGTCRELKLFDYQTENNFLKLLVKNILDLVYSSSKNEKISVYR